MGFADPITLPHKTCFNSTKGVLRLAVFDIWPFTPMTQSNGHVSIGGSSKEYVESIQAIARRNLVVVHAGKPDYGTRLENGTFTGIMGDFQKEKIDVLMAPALINEERFDLVESVTAQVSTYRLITWTPMKMIDPFGFADVFSVEVWTCIIATMFLLAATCWVMDRYLTPWNQRRKDTLLHFIWIILMRLFPQDPLPRQYDWLRICLMAYLLTFSVVLMNFLNSSMKSFMTMKDTEDSINGLGDFQRFPEVKIYVQEGTTLSLMFTDPKSDVLRMLRQRVVQKRIFPNYAPIRVLISDVESRKGVISCTRELCQVYIIRSLQRSGTCPRVMISMESTGLVISVILVSRKLPLEVRERIKRAILMAHESSVYEKITEYVMRTFKSCERRLKLEGLENSGSSRLSDFQGCFVPYIIGVAASIMALVAETTFARLRLKKKNVTEPGRCNDPKSASVEFYPWGHIVKKGDRDEGVHRVGVVENLEFT